MSNVIKGHFITKNDLNAPEMLRSIADLNPENVFVITWTNNDEPEPTYHSSLADMATVLMVVNEFIHKYYNKEFV